MIIKHFFVLLGIAALWSFPSFSANAQELKSPEAIAALMETVETRIAELQLINRQIETAPAVDQDALLYRRDERSFELLVLIDELSQSVIQMPDDDAVRQKISERLRTEFLTAGDRLFIRLNELDERIKDQLAALDSYSGSKRIFAESLVNTLQSMRMKFFEAAVNLVLSREALEIPVAAIRSGLVNEMSSYGRP